MDNNDILEKVYSIRLFSSMPPQEVMCSVASYSCNGTLAFQLFGRSEYGESADSRRRYCDPYGVATVNLPESAFLPYNVQFIDENNLPGIGAWLRANNIAHPTGYHCPSGYCLYEAYAFNLPEKDLKEVMNRRNELGTAPMAENQKNSMKIK